MFEQLAHGTCTLTYYRSLLIMHPHRTVPRKNPLMREASIPEEEEEVQGNDSPSKTWFKLRISRLLFAGSYLQVMSWALGQWKGRKNASNNRNIFLQIILVVALSLEEKHEEAIAVREGRTLPIYLEQLGDHPFTATILNNLSNNYYALGQYDKAKQYSNEALRMRQELLQDHRDTAKSLFDLGMVHKKRGELHKAKKCLERSQTIQERLLDDNIRDLQRTKEEIEEVRNLLA